MKRILVSFAILLALPLSVDAQNYYPEHLTKEQRDSIKAENRRIKAENEAKVGTKEIYLKTNFDTQENAAKYVIKYLLSKSIRLEEIDDNFFFIRTVMMKNDPNSTVGPGSLNTYQITFFFIETPTGVDISVTGKWCSNMQMSYGYDKELNELVFQNRKAFSTYYAFLGMEEISKGIPYVEIEYRK